MQSPKKIYRAGTLTYTVGGIAALFAVLLWGDFAWSMKERAIQSIAALTVKSFGISDFAYGLLIISFPSFTNIILGPIISYKSDRYRGRLGRRIPFLIFTTPFVVTGVIGMGFSPMLGKWLQQLIGVENISYHTSALFRAISLGAGILFNFWLLSKVETYALYICIALGVLYGFGFTLLCCRIKEGKYPPPPPVDETDSAVKGAFEAVKTYFRESFSLPYYRWVFLGYTLCCLTNSPINIFTIFYAKSIGMTMGELGKCLALTYMISFGLSYLLGILADRFHPLRMTIASIAFYGLVMIAGGTLVQGKISFAVFLIIHGVTAGSFTTLSASLPMRLFPSARFAQFCSAMGMVMALSSTLAAPVFGTILDWTGNNYRFTFWFGFIISLLALSVLFVVYRYFNAYGGLKAYRPPAPFVE